MWRSILFPLLTISAFGQSELAELSTLATAISAGYRKGDASAFHEHTHPDLIRKIRRLMVDRLGSEYSFAPEKADSAESVAALSDDEVLDCNVAFVSKITAVAPDISAEWSYPSAETSIAGGHATVVVSEHVEATRGTNGKKMSTTSVREFTFVKEDDRWLFLSDPATKIHVDFQLGIYE